MKKVRFSKQATELGQLPNVGPAMLADFKRLGIDTPAQLKKLLVDFGTDVAAYLDTVEKALIQDWADFTDQDPVVVRQEGESDQRDGDELGRHDESA